MDGYITIDTKIDTTGLEQSLKDVQKRLERSERNFSNVFSNVLKGILSAKVITATFRAITNQIDEAVSRTDTLNNFTKVMSNLGVSSEDASVSMELLNEKLKGLPTTLDDAALAVQRFTSANSNVKASTEMFLALNNAILAGGANTQIQASALEQLSQAYAKGKPDMMEWRTAMMAMPAQLKQVATAMGYVNSTELGEALRSGRISMDEFMATIVKLNKEGVEGFTSFEQQARNATGGIQTSMINVKTAITRGLANIMNAIGQSNIAGFFNSIASAIDSVIPYITAFVKVCATAVSFMASLFGKKRTQEIAETEKSISNLNASTGATASSMDDTTDSAKKLGKALKNLESFDEMNVLSESGTGTTTDTNIGIGGAGIDLSGLDIPQEQVTSVADEIANRIQAAFEKAFKGVDFSKFVESFNKLRDSIGRLIGNMGTDISWFIQNILLPLSGWTMSELLPAFFNILSGALNILNQAIEDLRPIFQDFLERILLPIAKWTGGVIVSVLNGIGDALNWISKNEVAMALLEGVLFVIGAIAAALAIYNAAIAVANVVTGIFAGIMAVLTSPITLVILAIGALIAIVLLLIKHWEDVQNVVHSVIENVKNAISIAVEWIKDKFNSIVTFFNNIITKIVTAFKTIGTKVGDAIGGAFKNVINKVLGSVESILNTPIKAINSLIGTINEIPGINIKKLTTLSLPKLAKGGIINMPGNGVMVGSAIAGESGREGVIPLTDSQQMAMLGEAIGKYITINANITNTMNGRVISRELQKVQNTSNFAFNR